MRSFFYLLSFFYQIACTKKNFLYKLRIFRPKSASLPVISVGNITFGGTEKTPLSINLLRFLSEQGFNPALISRGYKGKWEKQGGVLSDGKKILGTWEDSGDEPFMIAQNMPQAGIYTGKDRLLSCLRAKQAGFNVIVLDDGFQHRRLRRDLDIVLHNPLVKTARRELSFSFKRADILLVRSGVDSQTMGEIKKRFSPTDVFEYSVRTVGFFKLGQEEKEPVERLKGKRVIAFSGIAQPYRFISCLQKENIKPLAFLKFPDHHSYPPSSLERIKKKCLEVQAEAVLTTEKDAIKVANKKSLNNILVFYLKIDLELEERFYQRVLSILDREV